MQHAGAHVVLLLLLAAAAVPLICVQTQWVQDPVQKANFLELSSSAKLQTQPSADGDEDGPSAGADYTPAAAAVDTDRDVYAVPTPSQVGVHDGFDDLYNRRIEQPEYTERVRGGQQDEDSPEGMLSPRQVRL
jgi:hypothetical protein